MNLRILKTLLLGVCFFYLIQISIQQSSQCKTSNAQVCNTVSTTTSTQDYGTICAYGYYRNGLETCASRPSDKQTDHCVEYVDAPQIQWGSPIT